MIKYVVLLFNMLGLLIYQAIFSDPVTVTQQAPAQVAPGSEFTVELTINKGSIEGFAKLQQDLPEGFTATALETSGGDFTFTERTVRFIWNSLPAEASIKVSYKVNVGANVSGGQTIGGEFAWIKDNERVTAAVTPVTIMVGDAGANAAANTTADTTTTAANTASSQKTAMDNETVISGVNCVRSLPDNLDGDEFRVDITIKKGLLAGFAKLQESLPAGFTATAINKGGGEFSFSEQKVKFVWIALPPQEEIKVSYMVKVDKSVAGTGEKSISGLFSYIENDETRKFNIPASIINIKGGTDAIAGNDNNTTTDTSETAAQDTGKKDDTVAKNEGDANKTAGDTGTANKTGNEANENTSAAVVDIPAPQNGVLYRIQLAALKKPRETSWFTGKYGITGQVYAEMHEGLSKYTTGSFPMYKAARDEREQIKTKGVEGPFVTAYNNGKRITVQEALMITSQQWYR